MNTFYEHHKSSIKLAYRCFDRILLNGLIQPFQQPERVIGFFNAYRNAERVTRNRLRDIAQQFQNWLKNRCEKWGVPVLDAPQGRRDDFVDPYFKRAKTDEVVVILKAREPARIMIAIGSEDRWHLQLAQRWIVQYNFYINDRRWGRMGVLDHFEQTMIWGDFPAMRKWLEKCKVTFVSAASIFNSLW